MEQNDQQQFYEQVQREQEYIEFAEQYDKETLAQRERDFRPLTRLNCYERGFRWCSITQRYI